MFLNFYHCITVVCILCTQIKHNHVEKNLSLLLTCLGFKYSDLSHLCNVEGTVKKKKKKSLIESVV